jgi:hypothetical protein
MQVADAMTTHNRLEQGTVGEPHGITRTDPPPTMRQLRDRAAAVSDPNTASAARVRGVIVEGELGTWHERDAVDPAIPDIPFDRPRGT